MTRFALTWEMTRFALTWEMTRFALEHRAKKWIPVFRDKRCSIKNGRMVRRDGR